MKTHYRSALSRAGMLGVAALSLFAAPAIHASPITFVATGTLTDGATLSGFVVIDTATGVVQSADLSVSSPISLSGLTFDSSNSAQGSTDYQLLADAIPGSPSSGFVVLALPGTTLVGYSGGNICVSSCGSTAPSYAYDPALTSISFTSGSLTAAAPEPGSLALCIAGGALLAWKRRQRWQNTSSCPAGRRLCRAASQK
jgi:hypothetical protein